MSAGYERMMENAISELRYQYDLCVDQTGCEPSGDDYIGYIGSEDWTEKVGQIGLGSILNFLISRY